MGILSDKMKTIRIITFGQLICFLGIALLSFVNMHEWLFFAALACVAFNFGGHLTTYPPLVAEFFGINSVTKNYGVIYLGFGIGSFLGSVIATEFGGFHATFLVTLVLLAVSIIISTTISPPQRKREGDDKNIHWGL